MVAPEDSDGVVDQVRRLNESRRVLFADIPTFAASDSSGDVAVAYQWTTETHEEIHSLVNGLADLEWGMHVDAFKKSLTSAINRYCRLRIADPLRNVLLGSDIREGLTAVISVKVPDPPSAPVHSSVGLLHLRKLVERSAALQIGQWLLANQNEAALVVSEVNGCQAAGRGRERSLGPLLLSL